jgi:hypothetical protein
MSEIEQDRKEFAVWWEEERLRTWVEYGCDKDRGPFPSEQWSQGYRGHTERGYLAAREKSRAEITSLKAKVQELALQALIDSGQAIENLVDDERWASVAGYEGIYEVSTLGRIRSIDRVDSDGNRRAGRFLNPSAIKKGYLKVTLWSGNSGVERYVHRLVATAFLPDGGSRDQVNHKDGDPGNNALVNLEWVTNAENVLHAKRILLRGDLRPVVGIDQKTGNRVVFASLMQAAEAGFVRANIAKCINGERKTHRGYAWSDAAIDSALSLTAPGGQENAATECPKNVSGSGRATTGEGA